MLPYIGTTIIRFKRRDLLLVYNDLGRPQGTNGWPRFCQTHTQKTEALRPSSLTPRLRAFYCARDLRHVCYGITGICKLLLLL